MAFAAWLSAMLAGVAVGWPSPLRLTSRCPPIRPSCRISPPMLLGLPDPVASCPAAPVAARLVLVTSTLQGNTCSPFSSGAG